MGKLQTIVINLRRSDSNHPWGISLVGGSDSGTPLIITRVCAGSAAEGQVYRGDIIAKIGDYDSRDIRHQDAEALFRNAGNTIHVVIQRDVGAGVKQTSNSLPTSRASSALPPLSPLSLSPNPGNLPVTIFPQMDSNEVVLKTITDLQARDQKHDKNSDIEAVINQPYRTTPLVLPGAKVKHEPTQTESYLRHHPNPSIRQGYHLDTEVVMKQRVADSILQKVVGPEATMGGKQIVHKQFNSPINLYSEKNIADTIRTQTNVTPIKKNAVFDPLKSETLKALKEEQLVDAPIQEVANPVITKVFQPTHQPNRVPPAKKPIPSPSQINHTAVYGNALGNDIDSIQQSGSFKRLMHNVLGQSDF